MTSAGPNLDRRGFFRSVARSIGGVSGRQNWTRVEPAGGIGDGVLWGAAARHPEDIVVVGDDGLVLHYDGSRWDRQSNDSDLPLHAVAFTGSTGALSVGWLGIISSYESGVWRRLQGGETGPSESGHTGDRANDPLFGIWSDGSGDAWAVGDGGRIAHISGQTIHELETGESLNLRAIVGLPDGSLVASGADGIVLRGSGAAWERIDTETSCSLTGLAVAASGDLFAVGGEYSVEHQGFVGRIFHLERQGWRAVTTTSPLPRLREIVIDQDRALAVGDQGCVLRFDGSRISFQESETQHDLYGVVATGDERACACGAFGTLIREDRDASASPQKSLTVAAPLVCWKAVAQDVTRVALRAVWAESEQEVFAAGDSGTILHFDGTTWSKMESQTDVRLLGVWGSSSKDVHAVGEAGTILHFDGHRWQRVEWSHLDLTLVAITGFGSREIFAVGDGGTVLRFDGDTWQRVETGTRAALFAVWGLDPDHVLAAGEEGLVLRWNGQSWASFSAGTESAIYGIWGNALDRIFLVGIAGMVVRFDGSQWVRRPSHQRSDLLAVAGGTGPSLLAVGSLGTALRFEAGEWVPEDAACDETLRGLCVTPGGSAFAVGDSGRVVRRPARRR